MATPLLETQIYHFVTILRRWFSLSIAALVIVVLFSIFKSGSFSSSLSADTAAPPDSQNTAIAVSAINKPLHVLGSDGKEHLEYDLVSTNVFPSPVTLTSIEVTTADDRQLIRLAGDALKAMTQPLLNPTPTDQIPVSGAVATLIDVVVPPGKMPQQVTHRITYDFAPNTPDHIKTLIGSRQIKGPALVVNTFQPIAIASPLSGDGWFSANGCCDDASSTVPATSSPKYLPLIGCGFEAIGTSVVTARRTTSTSPLVLRSAPLPQAPW